MLSAEEQTAILQHTDDFNTVRYGYVDTAGQLHR
jgi:hypothetical protein